VDVTAPPGMFAAFSSSQFTRLWLSSAVVLLATMGQTVARSWLAFGLTGSNAALGGVLLSFGVALVLATPWGGVAADRLPKRLVLAVSVALLALTSAWIGLAIVLDVTAYWMLLVAGAIQAVAFALYNPARMAFLAELVPRPQLPGAVSLMLLNGESSRVAGPALAGVVIAAVTFGVEAVFLGSAVLFLAGLAVGLFLPAGRRAADVPRRSPVRELVDGILHVAHRPELSSLLLCGIAVVMLGLPYLAFLPTVAESLFDAGSAGYGVLSASSAVGAVAGGLALGARGRRGDQWRTLVLSGGAFGLSLVALALAPVFWVAVLVLVPLGAALLVFQTLDQALLLELSDLLFHGRIQGMVMLSFGAFGIAALPLGVLADAVGLRVTLTVMGVAVLLVVLVFALVSRRQRDRASAIFSASSSPATAGSYGTRTGRRPRSRAGHEQNCRSRTEDGDHCGRGAGH
jgi:MFS family permease